MKLRRGQPFGICLMLLGAAGLLWQGTHLPTPERSSVLPSLNRAGNTLNRCQVLIIFDGDTLGCDLNHNGRLERPQEQIRLLGIDAPEMHYSKKNKTHQDQPFAVEATRFLEENTLHKTVSLELDEQTHDRYGRTLAYVYPNPAAETSFNRQLIAKGYAHTLFIFPNNRYQSVYKAAERTAQQAHLGIWQEEPASKESPKRSNN